MLRRLQHWIVVLSIALLCSVASAQPKGKKAPAPFKPLDKTMSAADLAKLVEQSRAVEVGGAAAGPGINSLKDAKAMLEDLGYEPKVTEYMGYSYIECPTSSYSVYVDFNDKSGLLFITVNLGQVKDAASMPQSKLLGFLEATNAYCYFHYFSGDQSFQAASAIEGKIVTKPALKKRIEAVANGVAATQRSWQQDQPAK
jgi:hypothetical protein